MALSFRFHSWFYFTAFLNATSDSFQFDSMSLCKSHSVLAILGGAGHAAGNVTCKHLFSFPSLLPFLFKTTCWCVSCCRSSGGGRFLTSAAVKFSSRMRQNLPGTGGDSLCWRISVTFWQRGGAKRSLWPFTHVEMKLFSLHSTLNLPSNESRVTVCSQYVFVAHWQFYLILLEKLWRPHIISFSDITSVQLRW